MSDETAGEFDLSDPNLEDDTNWDNVRTSLDVIGFSIQFSKKINAWVIKILELNEKFDNRYMTPEKRKHIEELYSESPRALAMALCKIVVDNGIVTQDEKIIIHADPKMIQ